MKRMKINFASTHIHLTHNTQTYQRKMKNSRKFEKNREYRRNLPNWIVLKKEGSPWLTNVTCVWQRKSLLIISSCIVG